MLKSRTLLILQPANADRTAQGKHNKGEDMKDNNLLTPHVTDLLYQALETEKGGVQIYTTAFRCAVNDELREEWQEYLEQTKNHVQVVTDVLKTVGLNPETETPGRKIVRHIGTSLVKAMEMALRGGDPAAAQIVAAECVTLAETKDHLNWGLIGEIAKNAEGEAGRCAEGSLRSGRTRRGRAPLSHAGLDTGTLDRSVGNAGSASATRGKTEGRDGNRSRTSQEESEESSRQVIDEQHIAANVSRLLTQSHFRRMRYQSAAQSGSGLTASAQLSTLHQLSSINLEGDI